MIGAGHQGWRRLSVPPVGVTKLVLSIALAFLLLSVSSIALPVAAGSAATDAIDAQTMTADTQGAPLRVLIVHDQGDDPQLGRELAALLGHFGARCDITDQTYYNPGSIENFDATYFIGGSHLALSPDFLNDVANTSKPVVWIGRGLDQLEAVEGYDKYGFMFSQLDASGQLTSVTYKGQSLSRTDPVGNITYVTDSNKADVKAWMEGSGRKDPYAIQSGNFWYFADIPMVGVDANSTYSAVGATDDSAYLVLADLAHDVLQRDHPEQHLALMRIEDIHPKTDTAQLSSVISYLYHKGVPFGIAVVPVYRNPATGEEVRLSQRPDLVNILKDAQSKGATIIMHGYTHQLRGETVVDYEFWDRDTHAPPADETPQGVLARVDAGLAEMASVGITPDIWETPHYAASDMAHQKIASRFNVVWERRDAPFFPYPVQLATTGQTDIPETLGYVNPSEGKPADKLLETAGKQKVVRDNYAAFFFHPAIGGSQLRAMIEGLQNQGYTFVSPAQVAGLSWQAPAGPSWYDNAAFKFTDKVSSWLPDNLFSPSLLTFVAIFIILYYWGIFILSRKPKRIDAPVDPELDFYIVIPCLNEELVLGKTLDHLLSLPEPRPKILVVNDDSDDRTRDIALSYPRDRVLLLDHPHAVARQGKGRVLNYAFRHLMGSEEVRKKGTDKVIMGVLDADGRVEQNIIGAVNPFFSDPRAAAVQVGVKISNAATNVLTKWQNFEFLTFARISQKAREHLGSVGLGGNGQFVRLSALASLGENPWTDCLTEDLDLGLRLMLQGWHNHYSPDSFVAQQGVPKLGPLIRQRTRWFQGHVTCWRHIPSMMSRNISIFARTDTIYYLLAPILVFLFLPSSLMFVFWSIYFIITGASSVVVSPLSYLPALLVWYLFSFGALPTVVWTFWREDKEMSAWRAFLWAHVFSFFYVIWFIAACKAIYRIARGEGSWAKTARTEEPA